MARRRVARVRESEDCRSRLMKVGEGRMLQMLECQTVSNLIISTANTRRSLSQAHLLAPCWSSCCCVTVV